MIATAVHSPIFEAVQRAITDLSGGFNFAAIINDAGELAPYVTFTRSSTATYYGSDGLLETVAANEPRYDYDPATLQLRGLLIEEQRTNLISRSDDIANSSWIALNCTKATSSVLGPDGTKTLALCTANAVGGNRIQVTGINVTSGVNYTLTAYMQAGTSNFGGLVAAVSASAGAIFNLTGSGSVVSTAGTGVTASIQKVTATLYRCSMTFPATATATVNVGFGVSDGSTYSSTIYPSASSGTVYGSFVQLEAGAFATSYIPTTTAAVTRAVDLPVISSLANIGFNANEGSIFAQASCFSVGNLSIYTIFTLNDGTGGNNHRAYVYSNFAGGSTRTAGVNSSDLSGGNVTNNTSFKAGYAFKENDYYATTNGGAGSSDTSGVMPVVDRASIGASFTNQAPFNGHIRRLRYYPRRLTNAQLQALTA